VGIYSISTVDGAPLRIGAANILLDLLGKDLAKKVVAIKITEPDFEQSTLSYLKESNFKFKKIVQGWDSFYARAMKEGLWPNGSQHCGVTSGAAACMVFAYKAMYNAVEKQDWRELSKIQEVVSLVFFSMQDADKTKFPDLQIAKWVMGLGHPLTEERSEKHAERLLKTLNNIYNKFEPKYLNMIIDSLLLIDGTSSYYSPVGDHLRKLLKY
jgi:dihydrodipicolinate synthase/N-acetylneuraminate lyase